jgi:predicted enzyme related to lactoylglutathione lyase
MKNNKLPVGSVAWMDLTVPEASELKEFYTRVVGWQPSEVSMGDYSDFNMNSPETGQPMAGVCHARGVNQEIPPFWMIYIVVENLDESISRCQELGGQLISEPKSIPGHGRYVFIQDPAGAYSALFEPSD